MDTRDKDRLDLEDPLGIAREPVTGSGRWPACTASVLNPNARSCSSY